MSEKSLCESCKYAIIEGGDYCPGFGGCYTPEIICDCSNDNIQDRPDYEDMNFEAMKKCEYYMEEK